MNHSAANHQNCITRALKQLSEGEAIASEDLLFQIYGELRRMAAGKMKSEGPGHTLEPTALVHELWAKIAASDQAPSWPSRSHFFSWASKAMGNYLCDHARHKRTAKAGGGHFRIELDVCELIPGLDSPEATIDVLDAIKELATIDDSLASIVELRVFGGLSYADIADIQEVSEAKIKRSLQMAGGWLRTRFDRCPS